MEASRIESASDTLAELMYSLGLPAFLVEATISAYEGHREAVRSKLSELTPTLVALHSFAWRLDARIAQRSLHQIAEPTYMLKLTLDSTQKGNMTDEYLSADISALRHLQTELEAALRVARTQHARRVFRYVQ